jgi:hypothetical protein
MRTALGTLGTFSTGGTVTTRSARVLWHVALTIVWPGLAAAKMP